VVAAPSKPIEDETSGTDFDDRKTNVFAIPSVGFKESDNYLDVEQDSIRNELSVESLTDKRQLSEITASVLDESYATAASLAESISPNQHSKRSSTVEGDDINDIPESRTMLIQISDSATSISWLELLQDDRSTAKVDSALMDSSRVPKYSLPPLAPATVRVPKRDADSSNPVDMQQDAYSQYTITGYTAAGQPICQPLRKGNEKTQRQYIYPVPLPHHQGVSSSPYNSHAWHYAAPSVTLPPQQIIPHRYVVAPSIQQLHQRPISPPRVIGPPEGSTACASSPSTLVTAGEAAAMQRKKPRREADEDIQSESPPLGPSPSVRELQHLPLNHKEVPLVPGPPPSGPSLTPTQQQQQQDLPGQQPSHKEKQPWMIYQQMYQAQLQPISTHYVVDPSRMAVTTPESASRSFRHLDESPNNVTMTPGPGDGGGDHDEDTDFNRSGLL